jgi:hypothetical protein
VIPEPPATTTLRLWTPPEHAFPKLTTAQMDRVAAFGRLRRVEKSEVLLEMSESGRIFVVTADRLSAPVTERAWRQYLIQRR